MKQIKVKDTRMHKKIIPNHNDFDSEVDVPVIEAKLVLVKTEKYPLLLPKGARKEAVTPYLISETEEIVEDDLVYVSDLDIIDIANGEIQTAKFDVYQGKLYFKVLATPLNFSDKQMRAIAEGKIKEGDIVLLECDVIPPICGCRGSVHDGCQYDYPQPIVKLSKDYNYITIHHYNNWEIARPVIEQALGWPPNHTTNHYANNVIQALNKHYPR